MKGKAVTGVMSALLLASLLTLTLGIQPAKAAKTIYIRADGSIDPPTVPILTADSITYTFTGNIYDSIVVERGNILVDGAGCTLQGTLTGNGFDLSHTSNVTIKNANIIDFYCGIWAQSSHNNSIIGNCIRANIYSGIALNSSSSNSIRGNYIRGHADEPGSRGLGIVLFSSSYNSISGNNITLTSEGIALDSSSNRNSIIGNEITLTIGAIWLYSSAINCIRGNNMSAFDSGLDLVHSPDCTVAENRIEGVYGGMVTSALWVDDSSRCNFTRNCIYGGFEGFVLRSCSYCNVYENNVMSGVYMIGSSSNKFYHNNFARTDVTSGGSANVWDDGYPSGGNYWSDYVERYPDSQELDDSGIWDKPYVIDENNQDSYPLMGPWAPTPPTIMAGLDIAPDALNLKGKGKWITVYIQLPEGYDPAHINAATILLNSTVSPVLDPKYGFVTNSSEYLVDHNNDGILERMVKFDRATVESWIYQSVGMRHKVSLAETGELEDGTPFKGTETIFAFWQDHRTPSKR